MSYDFPSFGFNLLTWKLDTHFRDKRSYDLLSFRLRSVTRCIVPAPYGGLLWEALDMMMARLFLISY